MKLFIFFLLLFFTILSCSTEPNNNSGWTIQRDTEDNITYYAIHFSNKNNGWIVGYSGTIKKSSDGGKTWNSQISNVQANLWDIYFINDQIGWICGADNVLLKTTDGGENWNKIELSDSINITNVCIKFIDKDNGWISNNYGEILKSSDGGLNWHIVKQGNRGGACLTVFDENTIYALSGKLYKTFDSGLTWISIDLPVPKNYMIREMSFSDPNHGFIPTMNGTGGMIINEYPIMMTNDGGSSWRTSDSLKSESVGFTTVFFTESQNGWVAGNDIYRTKDGGSNWVLDFSGIVGAKDMHFINENSGWLMTYSGQVYKYDDK